MSNIGFYKRLFKFRIIFLFTFVFVDILLILARPLVYTPGEQYFLNAFDKITCLFLFIDLVFAYQQSDGNLFAFVKNHIFDIIAFIPVGFIYLRLFALLRLYKLFKAYLSSSNDKKEKRRTFIRNNILAASILFAVFYFIIATLFLAYFDPGIGSLLDSFWFNIVTASSVGYGDIVPESVVGKLTTAISVLFGALLISLFTSYLSAAYNQKPENENKQIILNNARKMNEDADKLGNSFQAIEGKIKTIEKDIDLLDNKIKKTKK